jgi:hypothetical protein
MDNRSWLLCQYNFHIRLATAAPTEVVTERGVATGVVGGAGRGVTTAVATETVATVAETEVTAVRVEVVMERAGMAMQREGAGMMAVMVVWVVAVVAMVAVEMRVERAAEGKNSCCMFPGNAFSSNRRRLRR